jgi:hypothetical protein
MSAPSPDFFQTRETPLRGVAFLNCVTGHLDRSLASLKYLAGVFSPRLLQVLPAGFSHFRVAHWRLLLPGLLFSLPANFSPAQRYITGTI